MSISADIAANHVIFLTLQVLKPFSPSVQRTICDKVIEYIGKPSASPKRPPRAARSAPTPRKSHTTPVRSESNAHAQIEQAVLALLARSPATLSELVSGICLNSGIDLEPGDVANALTRLLRRKHVIFSRSERCWKIATTSEVLMAMERDARATGSSTPARSVVTAIATSNTPVGDQEGAS
jgi:hypothetical protein